jgi:hypothetical protein
MTPSQDLCPIKLSTKAGHVLYRPLLLNPIGGVPALNQLYLETWLNMIKQCSHLNQTVLAGSITSLVYRHYAAHLDL